MLTNVETERERESVCISVCVCVSVRVSVQAWAESPLSTIVKHRAHAMQDYKAILTTNTLGWIHRK